MGETRVERDVRLETEKATGLRKCTKCGETKDIGKFPGNERQCKKCKAKYDRQQWKERSERTYEELAAYCDKQVKRYAEEATGLRTCTQCRETKEIGEFYKGYWQCKKCVAENTRQWAKDNPEQTKKTSRQWAKEHPENHVIQEHRRRAKKAGNGGDYTLEERKELLALLGNSCACCRRPDLKLEIDHIQPINAGGTSFIANLQPLCVSCNRSKGARVTFHCVGVRLELGLDSEQDLRPLLRQACQLGQDMGLSALLPLGPSLKPFTSFEPSLAQG